MDIGRLTLLEEPDAKGLETSLPNGATFGGLTGEDSMS